MANTGLFTFLLPTWTKERKAPVFKAVEIKQAFMEFVVKNDGLKNLEIHLSPDCHVITGCCDRLEKGDVGDFLKGLLPSDPDVPPIRAFVVSAAHFPDEWQEVNW